MVVVWVDARATCRSQAGVVLAFLSMLRERREVDGWVFEVPTLSANGRPKGRATHGCGELASRRKRVCHPPNGRDTVEFALRTEEAVPMAKLVDTYGCFAGVLFAGASLDLARQDPDWRTGVGAAGATFGCVSLYFPEESANVVMQGVLKAQPWVNYAFCGFAIEALIHDLNEVAEGKENAVVAVTDGFGALTGCVGARLSSLVKGE